MNNKITVGTRSSLLALAQTNMVIERIKASFKELEIETKHITTLGDKNLKTNLWGLGGKGAFVTEIENQIVSGEIDFAVHSGKDLPLEIDSHNELFVVLPREDARDVIVANKNIDLNGSINLGTASLRRETFIKDICPNATCSLLRGNVPTRLQKLKDGEFDAIILAMAGLKRLNLLEDSSLKFKVLDAKELIPAACQGIIVVECLKESRMSQILKAITDKDAFEAMQIERYVLAKLEGGCHEAIGVHANFAKDNVQISYRINRNGKECSGEIVGNRANWQELADQMLKETYK